ncbi:MAG: VWA domain-containing protein [Holophagales bacterium]|nr:VWA domain-containing protein [Holophagales bacterium]MYF94223.1 VWA domain-containing protein [Holophagales bacterium]
MKPLRREPAIFGVAAIDLFASALGAFIVVALVLLPYFPNTGDATGTDVDAVRARAAQAEAERDSARLPLEQASEAGRPVVQALPPIDLVIALDTTGSMTGEVASLREEIAGLAELLVSLTEDAAIGIIDFKDGCGGAPALRIAPLRTVDGRTVPQLAAFARSMSAGAASCNTTPDEDFAEALRAATASSWRPSSERRSIVLVTDNPAHAHLRDQAIADARTFAARSGAMHTVSTVFVDPRYSASRSYPETASFLRQVAVSGGGQFVRSSENASLSMMILRAIFG